ncbi:hypothetical protein FHETE_562 [Fusarium heterosporum]|uniref:Uncharacterized protein n=1 Tax=Fusarium heterosporum TaxID=42747 RepID=A0A8H5TX85_FUSHE|nr:hypothetical protein FHETE_562 [Fusarium heterosporum]
MLGSQNNDPITELASAISLKYRCHDRGGKGFSYPTAIDSKSHNTSEMLLVREVAMMIVMDRLTDKPDWHLKVYDDTITDKWIQEALALPVEQLYDDIVTDSPGSSNPKMLTSIFDRECLEYCIKELRAKAKFFEETGLVPTLDVDATAVKSDSLVDENLRRRLQAAFATLTQDQNDNPDWHPRTNDKVRNLVHPSLYPFVYGRSRLFLDEVVGVKDAVHRWSGKGEVIPKVSESSGIPAVSDTYQWLPANVKFQEDGSVKFTSYINGLHPNKYPEIYRTIETLVEKALPAWDFCLKQVPNYLHGGPSNEGDRAIVAGRKGSRFPRPRDPDDENEENWTPYFEVFKRAQHAKRGESDKDDSISNPASSDSEDYDEDEVDYEAQSEGGNYYSGTRGQVAWQMMREPVQPAAPEFKAVDYGVKPGDSLRERFKDIQIIVKMASIELTPDKPEFPAGSWHVEGQQNEHIIGTALYYLDSENVTPSHLQFRMSTISDDDYNVGQDSFNWMERVYGTVLRDAQAVQRYGSVETKQGRLLAFPNVFHHRVSPFELQDKTKPGHRRFIALWLVDPYRRVINTGNVPPQQQSWWMEQAFQGLTTQDAEKIPSAVANLLSQSAPGHSISALDAATRGGGSLPGELMNMVKEEAAKIEGPMSLEEAKEHRLKLMDERTQFQSQVESEWESETYNFCEH